MKTIMGVLLLAVGFSLFLLLFLNALKIDTVIDVSFVLLAGEKYEPYENGTYHHTRVFTKSSLKGEVTVQGEEISFTANGYNTQHLKNILMSQNSSFVIDPAGDLYTFTFDNSRSSAPSSVRFLLKEMWTDTLSLIIAFISLLAAVPIAILLIVMGLRKRTQKML